MSKEHEILGKRVVSFFSSAVDTIVLIIFLAILVLSAYALWDARQVYSQADASNYQAYKPDRTEHLPSYNDLVAMNPDVFGWLQIYGTKIDYPLVQGQDNEKYLNTDPTGKYSYSGSLFLDSKASRDFSDFASIIYGHHMAHDEMFGSLDKFADREFFDQHQYGDIYYGNQHHGLVILGYIQVPDVYKSFVYQVPVYSDGAMGYYSAITQEALYMREEVDVGPNDHLALLSTCASDDNRRLVLVTKITDQTYPNTFGDEVNSGSGLQNVFNGIAGFLQQHRFIPLAVLIALILLYILMTRSKKGIKAERSAATTQQNRRKV